VHAIINFAYRFVRNREVAEELAQEIFLKVHEAADSYKAQARFSSWLYRIATNMCLNEVRKPQYRMTVQWPDADRCQNSDEAPADFKAPSDTEPDKLLEHKAVANVLKQALKDIPEKQRVAFILNKYQELSYAEVAESMRISEKAVKSLIHRAKETMAERLRPLLPELIK
jgi:RNA polymerase sigma-70 factor (ECF subfamily)